jgi:voltage-gated hydrogen channel 1
VLVLIVLDVAGILSDIFIALVTCELGIRDEKWVAPTREALTTFSLVLSSFFLAELLLSLWAEGLRYVSQEQLCPIRGMYRLIMMDSFLGNWFHCFDAFVIVGSFCIDVLENNLAEEIASLIVILRLWRFVKIVNEFSVEASEQMEDLRRKVEELEMENKELRARLGHADTH